MAPCNHHAQTNISNATITSRKKGFHEETIVPCGDYIIAITSRKEDFQYEKEAMMKQHMERMVEQLIQDQG